MKVEFKSNDCMVYFSKHNKYKMLFLDIMKVIAASGIIID